MANGTCKEDDGECGKPVLARGLCRKHYADARAERLSQEQCKTAGCTSPRGATGGYCTACYQRDRAFGDPNAGPPRRKRRGDATAKNSAEHPDSYFVNHRRVRVDRGAAWLQACEHCGQRAREWATIHGRSGDDPADFMPLCKTCHNRYDGLSANLPHHEGETHPQAKLTDEVVREIRTRIDGGHPDRHLVAVYATTYRVTPTTIMNVVNRRTWKHLT